MHYEFWSASPGAHGVINSGRIHEDLLKALDENPVSWQDMCERYPKAIKQLFGISVSPAGITWRIAVNRGVALESEQGQREGQTSGGKDVPETKKERNILIGQELASEAIKRIEEQTPGVENPPVLSPPEGLSAPKAEEPHADDLGPSV